ncbi:hypothetical protein SDC9_62042 [bioreactor metagenome]|uniref:Portal protein n=1 Tax=bioreactor metagenome TaxID=1076179 RepID=A0A644XIR4_9ZZZZ
MIKMRAAPEKIWQEYQKGIDFKTQLNLYDTVEANENFYIGKQWEGVTSNGLPTPTFNFVRRIVLYLIASTATDNLKLSSSPLSSAGPFSAFEVEKVCSIVNAQFDALFEQNKLGKMIRDFMRNAAVDGDACIYTYFDPELETGQKAKGGIRAELLENTRVFFGDPNSREVQSQPYLIISRRETVEEVKRRAERFGGDSESVKPDGDDANNRFDAMTEGKCTTVLKLWKDAESGEVHGAETARNTIVRPEWNTGQKLYPLVWMPWDFVQNCYHGQAAVTGLIPNQVFVNKMFAMTMLSLMTTAYPKIVYDRTRISKWDSRVGAAIGVNGGDVANVAKTIDPAAISPQVSQFINLAINLTKEFMGATDAALGDMKPDNTSAIIALQKASSVPMELTKHNLYQCIEELGIIWLDMMRTFYGVRYVEAKPTGKETAAGDADEKAPRLFDFAALSDIPMSLKLDVGGSAYWSEIAQMNTLDNLLMKKQINVIDYLERVPNGYISNQQELIDTLRERQKTEESGSDSGGMSNLKAGGGGLPSMAAALPDTASGGKPAAPGAAANAAAARPGMPAGHSGAAASAPGESLPGTDGQGALPGLKGTVPMVKTPLLQLFKANKAGTGMPTPGTGQATPLLDQFRRTMRNSAR